MTAPKASSKCPAPTLSVTCGLAKALDPVGEAATCTKVGPVAGVEAVSSQPSTLMLVPGAAMLESTTVTLACPAGSVRTLRRRKAELLLPPAD